MSCVIAQRFFNIPSIFCKTESLPSVETLRSVTFKVLSMSGDQITDCQHYFDECMLSVCWGFLYIHHRMEIFACTKMNTMRNVDFLLTACVVLQSNCIQYILQGNMVETAFTIMLKVATLIYTKETPTCNCIIIQNAMWCCSSQYKFQCIMEGFVVFLPYLLSTSLQ